MATSPAIYSLTTLEVKITGSYHAIQGVTNIGGPNFSKAEIDVTHMGSTAKEYKAAALSDAGTLTFGLQYAPTNFVHSYIVSQSAMAGGATDIFRMTFSDASKWGFSGSFLEFNLNADDPAQGILTADCSVRLTGAVNFAAA
jgi:hypothetical protein